MKNDLPLIIIPTELDSDQIFEPHVETMTEGILNDVELGAAQRVVVDLEVIAAADLHQRAGMVADMLAIVTGLLDWRYAVKMEKNALAHPFMPWAAGVAAGIASQTLKIAPQIGEGDPEALRTLLDLTALSVQLANQLGHDRHQEGTEHYLAFALENQGVHYASHAECLAPGILLTSALHGQDPAALREALLKAGVRLDVLRPVDLQQALNNLPNFVETNGLPHGIAHDIDPYSDMVKNALATAQLSLETGGWAVAQPTAPAAAGATSSVPSPEDTEPGPPPAEESNPA
ncbi:MAG: iron-containing alcohol dehydrogenase [Anaerolineae bacterium]|nr:iron-containing alcohol dehydrogenase [Anaerolineae bacterium]